MSHKTFSLFKNEKELKEMEKTVETNGKRDLVILPDGIYGLFEIKWEDGRSMLPESLRGLYTSQSQAEKAIKKYIKNHHTTKHKEKREREYERDEKIRLGVKNGESLKAAQDKEAKDKEEKEKIE